MIKAKREGFFTHTLSDRDQKKLMIFELIRKQGPMARADISRITDINLMSVSNYVKEYMDRKLMTETVSSSSTGGRRAEVVELNGKGAYVAGLDIGESEARAVVTDLALNVVGQAVLGGLRDKKQEIASVAIGLLRKACEAANIKMDEVVAVGIGVSSDDGELRSEIEKVCAKETFMGPAASCAAYGEKKLNPEADVDNILYMYSDVGCGIIVRGDIYFGSAGSAGEMKLYEGSSKARGETVFLRDSRYLGPWTNDLKIAALAKNEIAKGIGTKMVALAKGHVEDVSLDVVVAAAIERDDIAVDIIQNAAKNLGIRIAYLVNLFNPEAVVIGGGMEKAGALALDPIRDMVTRFSFKEQSEAVKIIPSALGENAVCMGAASLTVREIFIKA